MMRIIFALALVAGFTGTALAADAVSASDPSMTDAAKAIFDAVMHGQWWAAAALGVVLACAAARRYLPSKWTEGTKGDIIGTAMAFLMAGAGAIATVMAAPGAAMTTGVALTALKIGVAAIGGYNIIHKLASWAVASGKLPAWALPIVKLLTSLVGSNAVAKAERLGDKAVAASPPKGMSGGDKIIEVD